MYTELSNSIDLSGQVAIVTGGGAGVGEGITRALLTCGAKVMIVGRSDAHQQKAAELGESAAFCRADISSQDECDRAVAETVAKFGGLHILVNNASARPISFHGALDEDMDKWQMAMDISLRGTYQMCRAAAAVMVEQKQGSIVNISSIGSLRSMGGDVAYTSSKAAVNALTQNLANQWGRHGVRVNCVVVGVVDAGLTNSFEQTEEMHKAMLAAIPLGRRAQSEEMGWPVAFLASSQASFINGSILVADGGQLTG